MENVRQVYQHLVALDGVSLALAEGELAFLVGPSGAGKSTILKLIHGELPPQEGMLWVDGMALHRLPSSALPGLRRRVGAVFQDYRLLPRFTAVENVAYAVRVADLGIARPDVADLARTRLAEVGLASRLNAYPYQLSGGQQQRLAIARALVTQPRLLLADEPTGNLDPDTARSILDLLEEISNKGTTVLVASHDLELVAERHRRVIQLSNGRLVSDSGGEEVLWAAS